MNKYAIKYELNADSKKEGYDKEEAENGKYGLCDAFIFISIIQPEDGRYSIGLYSADGKEKRDLTHEEIFKAWLMLGISLYDNKELKGWRHEFVKFHAETIRMLMKHDHDCKGC